MVIFGTCALKLDRVARLAKAMMYGDSMTLCTFTHTRPVSPLDYPYPSVKRVGRDPAYSTLARTVGGATLPDTWTEAWGTESMGVLASPHLRLMLLLAVFVK